MKAPDLKEYRRKIEMDYWNWLKPRLKDEPLVKELIKKAVEEDRKKRK